MAFSRGPRRSKFGVDISKSGKLARTYGDRTYDSLAEMRYAMILDLRKKVGEILDWWPQQSILLKVNGVLICKMIADFKLLMRDKTIEYIEVKGVSTAAFKLKLKLLRALHPEIRYTLVPASSVR